MLTNVSPSPSPAHTTSTTGLINRQQNRNLTEYKADKVNSVVRDCDVLPNSQKHYGTTANCIRKSMEISTIEECESMLSKTHSSSASSTPSVASSSSSSSSDEELMNANLNDVNANRTNQLSDIQSDSCRNSIHNLSRRASNSSKVSTTRYSSCASNCSRHRTPNGATIHDLTPPDLVADIYDRISNGSDIQCGDKAITDNVSGLLSNDNNADSKETSV